MARNPAKVPCSATTAAGRPCPNWAQPGTDRCRSHANTGAPNPAGASPGNHNARTHGLYAAYMDDDDLAALAAVDADADLADEIALTRVAIRRLAELLTDDEPANPVELASALFTGTGRVAMLLKAQRAISGEAADGIAGAIGQALAEIGNELGIEL